MSFTVKKMLLFTKGSLKAITNSACLRDDLSKCFELNQLEKLLAKEKEKRGHTLTIRMKK